MQARVFRLVDTRDNMLGAVTEIEPDLIGLDFAADGATVETLKGDDRTKARSGRTSWRPILFWRVPWTAGSFPKA
jgi:hypothetical protein